MNPEAEESAVESMSGVLEDDVVDDDNLEVSDAEGAAIVEEAIDEDWGEWD